jgi:hypothetical protein
MRIAYAWALVLLLGTAGCSNKSSCKPDLGDEGPAGPCRNATTVDDAGAVGTPQCFVQAQVCPGKGGFPFCERPVGMSFRDSVEIQNAGESDLTIYSVRARGDSDCAFVDPELRDPDGGVPLTVKPQETILFSFRFTPPHTGTYNALIEIESNAENYPILRIPVCGIGVPEDNPPNPVDDGGVQQCGQPMCDDVSSADVSSCGPGWINLSGQQAADGG